MGAASGAVRQLGTARLNNFMVALGRAYGPEGCRHFSELTLSEQVDLLNRVPILRKTHEDWGAFKWVPRALTAYVMPGDAAPPIIMGDIVIDDKGEVVDIPKPGDCVITRGYMAWSSAKLPDGSFIHSRFGFRWDRNDKYITITIEPYKRLAAPKVAA